MSFRIPEVPPIGTPIQFLNGGDRRNTVAGVMQDCNDTGIARISIIPRSGGTVEVKLSVHHIDDPHLKEHPELAARNGAWDYHPWFVPKPWDIEPDNEEQVLQWASEYEFATVVKKASGLGLKKADVQRIYDRLGLSQDGKGET